MKDMDSKLEKYLKIRKLEELATLRGLVLSLIRDYDTNLTTYAAMNDDKAFKRMPPEIEDFHERRNKLTTLLMGINAIIEEKLFKLYE